MTEKEYKFTQRVCEQLCKSFSRCPWINISGDTCGGEFIDLKEENMVKVYIKIDEESNITEVGSSIFIEDTEGWIEIDEGSGDRYVHAQGNYLPGPIRDEDGNYRYKYVNGEIYEVVQDDKNQTHLVLVTIE